MSEARVYLPRISISGGVFLRRLAIACVFLGASGSLAAQELRYTWFEIAYLNQDVDRMGSLTDIALGQTVDVTASDGNGIRFRGSVGTWHNLYAFVDYSSADIDIEGVVTNAGGVFPAADNFDHIQVRLGGGFRYPVAFTTDVYGEVSLDYVDLDFGSFAGENFDTDEQDVGATLGVRSLIKDRLELRAFGRYTNVGDANISGHFFDSDLLYGVGFGIQMIRGLTLAGEYESGEHSRWSIGFRLDLSEDDVR